MKKVINILFGVFYISSILILAISADKRNKETESKIDMISNEVQELKASFDILNEKVIFVSDTLNVITTQEEKFKKDIRELDWRITMLDNDLTNIFD